MSESPAVSSDTASHLKGVRLYRVDPAENRVALAVLLTGRADPTDASVDQFRKFSRHQGLDLSELWIAEMEGEPKTAGLFVPGEGRTTMLLLAPTRREAVVSIQSALIQRMMQELSPKRVRLVQALLEPQQHLVQRALHQAGFQELAHLHYMQRNRLPSEAMALNLADHELEVFHWRESERDRFSRAIEATYEQTLDCPQLLGLRAMEDIIAGHMSAGVFDPKLWFAFYRGDEPAGVMLLNILAGRRAVELVYLGLAPAFRRQGLATRILKYGMNLCGKRDIASMLVAVDEQNTPAVQLYHRLGFRITGRKVAMIQTLNEK